jgi:hypothetical protein
MCSGDAGDASRRNVGNTSRPVLSISTHTTHKTPHHPPSLHYKVDTTAEKINQTWEK